MICVCFRQMDINEEKVPWKDAILRRAQDSTDCNQIPAFCALPAWVSSAELLSCSGIIPKLDGAWVDLVVFTVSAAGFGSHFCDLTGQDCKRSCWEFVSSLVVLTAPTVVLGTQFEVRTYVPKYMLPWLTSEESKVDKRLTNLWVLHTW